MLGGLRKTVPTGSGPWVAVLAVVFLFSMAFAIPAAPIEVEPEVKAQRVRRGFLVGASLISERLAEQLGREGYTYLAIDLTRARLDREELWRTHFDRIAKRRFALWGWVDVRDGLEQARGVVRSLNLEGLYVYGPDAAAAARTLARVAPQGIAILPVLRLQDAAPPDETYAMAMRPEEFAARAGEYDWPVLLADQLDAAGIEAACAKVGGNYLVVGIAIVD
ncbi:MAG: hypothetical protein ACYTEZ_07810 [Planctomycetota bacterium]|jgi:hypothetical protein